MKRNPNGYGSVSKLSGNRRRPWIVRRTVGWTDEGKAIVQIIGYAETRQNALYLLSRYNNEPWDVEAQKTTLSELYGLWRDYKASRASKSVCGAMSAAYKWCRSLELWPYRDIKAVHMQRCIDDCPRSYATKNSIRSFWSTLDRLALELDISEKNYSRLLSCEPVPETSRGRLTDGQIRAMWEHLGAPYMDTALLLVYSGWRISELLGLCVTDTDLAAGTMRGGVKTAAGKNRIVPIHSAVLPLVHDLCARSSSGWLVEVGERPAKPDEYRKAFRAAMREAGIADGVTPHWCRHTFESLLDGAGANRKCIDMMMGHVSSDTGNRVYNHKTIAELRAEIEKIKAPKIAAQKAELVTHLQHSAPQTVENACFLDK